MKILPVLSSIFFLSTTTIASPFPPIEDVAKRTPLGSFSLYDYTSSYDGVRLFYADGLAYFGNPSAWPGTLVTDITFTFTNGKLTTSSSTNPLPPNTHLYFVPSTNITEVGFTGPNTPTDAVVDEWAWYGAWLMREEDESGFSSSFYVKETGVEGVWQLYWSEGEIRELKKGNVRSAVEEA